MSDPRSSPFASYVYNNIDNTKHPHDWFEEERDLREEEYFSYSYIMEFVKCECPKMFEEIDKMFEAYALMERIRRNGDEFYKAHFPSLTPDVYEDMYLGICLNVSGQMSYILKGKWAEFVDFCEMNYGDIMTNLTFKRDDDYENMIVISWDERHEKVDRYMTKMYQDPQLSSTPILKKIISYYPSVEKGNILFKQNADGCFYATLVSHDSYTISYAKVGDEYVFQKKISL